MSEAVDATPALPRYEELDGLIAEWNNLIARPQQPVPFWQMISMTVGEILYRARDSRRVYSDDVHGAAAMVAAAGTWRLERQGGNPYAEWQARVLPVFACLEERSPRRPAEHRKTWPPNQVIAAPAVTRSANCGRSRSSSPGGITFPGPLNRQFHGRAPEWRDE